MGKDRRIAAAVVVAGGSGSRFGDGGPRKQYRELLGRPLLSWSLRPFIEHPSIGPVVVVLPAEDVDTPPAWLLELPVHRVAGGASRSASVRNGLEALRRTSAEVVLIHDGARPLVSADLIDRVLQATVEHGAIPGVRVTDTLKEVDGNGTVVGTLDRERYWRVQTPQAFPLVTIRQAYERAEADGVTATDDAAIFERYIGGVRIVDGDPDNIKVTVPIDFDLAELLASRLLRQRGPDAGGPSAKPTP